MKTYHNIKTLFFCLLALPVLSLMAQEDKSEIINRIKLDSNYLYAENTMADEAEAFSGAQALLEMMVIDWINCQAKTIDTEAFIKQAKQHFIFVKAKRGQYHRAFLYVKKSDLISIDSGNSATIVGGKSADALTRQAFGKQNTVKESVNVSSEKPVKVAEERKTTIDLTTEEKQLATITQFNEVEERITALEEAGKLTGYGKKKTMPVEGVCHLLVYNRQGSIVAVLRRENNGKLINLRALSEDNVKNYPDCGAIWLKFKN